MSKKQLTYTGTVEIIPSHHIYLNIKNLQKGPYTLKIMHKNKVIKQITFEK